MAKHNKSDDTTAQLADTAEIDTLESLQLKLQRAAAELDRFDEQRLAFQTRLADLLGVNSQIVYADPGEAYESLYGVADAVVSQLKQDVFSLRERNEALERAVTSLDAMQTLAGDDVNRLQQLLAQTSTALDGALEALQLSADAATPPELKVRVHARVRMERIAAGLQKSEAGRAVLVALEQLGDEQIASLFAELELVAPPAIDSLAADVEHDTARALQLELEPSELELLAKLDAVDPAAYAPLRGRGLVVVGVTSAGDLELSRTPMGDAVLAIPAVRL